MKKRFDYNEDTGISTCILYYKDKKITGTAKIHPEDRDMMSERTGLSIAEMRADIKYLKDIKKN